MSTRRSNRGMRSDALSALADLKNRKATGKSRTVDYELEQAADIYETVDEQTYAAISAKERKKARDFIDSNDNDYNEHYGMEEEFAIDDQLSLFQQQNRKRRRTVAPKGKKPVQDVKHTQRVASSFFNSFQTVPKGGDEEAADGTAGVLDVSMLDKDFERHISSDRSKRRRKAALEKRLGDMLFDAPAVDNHDPLGYQHMPIPQSHPQSHPNSQEIAPPTVKTESEPVHDIMNSPADTADEKPSLILEDSLDADALLAAADAAMSKAAKPTTKPIPAPKQPPARAPVRAPVGHFPVRGLAPNLPMAREQNGDVLMFWTDAHEVRSRQGGQILYLFGKVPVHDVSSNVFASVCVEVKNMERVLYVLPRETKIGPDGKSTNQPIKIVPDVHSEIKDLVLGSTSTKSNRLGGAMRSNYLPSQMKAKVAVRSCPFGDKHAPREATKYLKVKIPFETSCPLQSDSTGATFSRVYGTTATPSERLCLKRKLKGPGWIRLTNATNVTGRPTHAKFNLSITGPEDISVPPALSNKEAPPLSAMCVNVKTTINAKTGAHELVMLAGVLVHDVPLSGPMRDGALEPGGPAGTRDFVLVRAPDGVSVPFGFSARARSLLGRGGGVEVVSNEAAMLNNFMGKLVRIDPDVIIGHDINGFGMDVLLSRMKFLKSRDWSRLGRLIQRRDLTQYVKNNTCTSWFKAEAVAGRLVVDTYSYAKELLTKEKDYSISALSQNILVPGARGSRGTISTALPRSTDASVVPLAFQSTEHLSRLVRECSAEARASGHLASYLNILPLTRQLTCISGNLWSHTLQGKRAERIEYLLCHEFKLIGSKHGGSNDKAGDLTAKLLLPDKLNKSQREKLQTMWEAEEQKNITKESGDVEPAEIQEYGYGGLAGAEQQTPGTRPTPKSAAAKGGATKSKTARRKPQYSGGLVLEPKKGFYDRYVLQLDFNSLYPSIIQEFNICFSTLDLGGNKNGDEGDAIPETPLAGESTPGAPKALGLPKSSLPEGVLPRVLRRLVLQRREVKKLLKEEIARSGRDSLRAHQLDIRQLAIKLTANSLYGCLGFEGSRFFARPLAEMVTYQGRDTLQKTVDLARESFNAQVIYGDTDSLFVYTGLDDITGVRKLGMELKRDVNKKYRTLEIEIDAIYKKMLLLKKKKYAALKVIDPTNPDKTVREVKGLDLVRHDWCDLSHQACEHFITEIFKGQSSNIDDAIGNILSFLTSLSENVKNDVMNKTKGYLAKYVITRGLNKRPQDYPASASMPHVKVALRLIQNRKLRIKPGDYIKYVICKQEGSASVGIADRAYHPDEIEESEGKLVVDEKYYLESQVLPPVMRLCEPIESIEPSRIAISLGLDGRRYEQKNEVGYDDENCLSLGPQSAAEKYKDCDPVLIKCSKCSTSTEFRGPIFRRDGKKLESVGLECVRCHQRFSEALLQNVFTFAARDWVKRYYSSPLVLRNDSGMETETRTVYLNGRSEMTSRQVDEAWLYRQLRYLHYLVDVETRWSEVPGYEHEQMPLSRTDAAIYQDLGKIVGRTFDRSDYRYIDLATFLQPLGIS